MPYAVMEPRDVEDGIHGSVGPVLAELGLVPARIEPQEPGVRPLNLARGCRWATRDFQRVWLRYAPADGSERMVVMHDYSPEGLDRIRCRIHGRVGTLFPEVALPTIPPFRLENGEDQVGKLFRFLAARIVHHREAIAMTLPDMAPAIARAATTEAWVRAGAEHDALLRNRLILGTDERWVPGRVAFRGAKMLLVDTDSLGRFTLSLDTTTVPKESDVELGSFWMLPGNSRKPRYLRVAGKTIELDPPG